MKKTFINLTPHALNIVKKDGDIFTIEPSGSIARISSTTSVVEEINGVEMHHVSFGEIQGLPEQQADTIYIVSAMVKGAAEGRKDIASPGALIRNNEGQPVGCNGLNF